MKIWKDSAEKIKTAIVCLMMALPELVKNSFYTGCEDQLTKMRAPACRTLKNG